MKVLGQACKAGGLPGERLEVQVEGACRVELNGEANLAQMGQVEFHLHGRLAARAQAGTKAGERRSRSGRQAGPDLADGMVEDGSEVCERGAAIQAGKAGQADSGCVWILDLIVARLHEVAKRTTATPRSLGPGLGLVAAFGIGRSIVIVAIGMGFLAAMQVATNRCFGQAVLCPSSLVRRVSIC